MNRHLRKQSTRNQCTSRLSSLSSHISTGELEVKLRYTDHYRLPEAVEKELNATFHHSR
jgi:hypothetical protein